MNMCFTRRLFVANRNFSRISAILVTCVRMFVSIPSLSVTDILLTIEQESSPNFVTRASAQRSNDYFFVKVGQRPTEIYSTGLKPYIAIFDVLY